VRGQGSRVSVPDPAASSLARRLRRHGDQIAAGGRSPLSVELMRGAAADAEGGGVVAELFAGLDAPAGSVPALRLLGALHRIVLDGRAGELAAFYPSAGGDRPPEGAWPVAAATLRAHADEVRTRLPLTVQTNDPGRAAALYGALLALVERHGLPVRLLEIGASGGLNLQVDRYAYVVRGTRLGAPDSPVVIEEPWEGQPVPDPRAAAGRLRIVERAGCDPAPLDPRDPEDRLTLLSYVWPDEVERLQRLRAALELAAADPPPVTATEDTAGWLGPGLAQARDGELTVVWQSVVRQYVDDEHWAAIEAGMGEAGSGATDERPLAWVTMEPGKEETTADFELAATVWPGGEAHALAGVGAHGPPVSWH
jgi:hypothetical protein